MTADLLKRARELAEAATPGPWRISGIHEHDDDLEPYGIHEHDDDLEPYGIDEHDDDLEPYGIDYIESVGGERIVCADSGVYPPYGSDAEFIAAARTLVPELCAEVERLQGEAKLIEHAVESVATERDQLRAELDQMRTHVAHNDEEYATMKGVLRAEHEECKRLRDQVRNQLGFAATADHWRARAESAEREAERMRAERDAARKALSYAFCEIDGYEGTFDAAYEMAGARCAHGEWYWPTAIDAARAKERGE